MQIDYKYTWRIPQSAWYIRLYLWAWQAQETDVTFCKLFWGYVFMWFALPVRSITVAIYRFCHWIATGVRAIYAIGAIPPHTDEVLPARPPMMPVVPIVTDYEWAGGPSVIGTWLHERVQKILPKRKTTENQPATNPFMRRVLVGIETSAAWVSMQRKKLVWNVLRPGARVISKLFYSIVVILAFIAGAVGAILTCTGKVLVGAIMTVAPPVWTGLTKAGEACWTLTEWVLLGLLLWPARRLTGIAQKAIMTVAPPVWTGLTKAGEACWTLTVWVLLVLWTLLWPARRLTGIAQKALTAFGFFLALVYTVVFLVGAIGAAVYLLGGALFHPLVALLVIGILFGTLAICSAFGFAVAYAAERWLVPGVAKPLWTGTKVGTEGFTKGSVSFGRVMLIGYKAVKSNTCPRIEVEK